MSVSVKNKLRRTYLRTPSCTVASVKGCFVLTTHREYSSNPVESLSVEMETGPCKLNTTKSTQTLSRPAERRHSLKPKPPVSPSYTSSSPTLV